MGGAVFPNKFKKAGSGPQNSKKKHIEAKAPGPKHNFFLDPVDGGCSANFKNQV